METDLTANVQINRVLLSDNYVNIWQKFYH